MDKKTFLVITLMFIAFATPNSALAQNSSSTKNDLVKSSIANHATQPKTVRFPCRRALCGTQAYISI